jgi:hypothetical protein
MNLTSEKISEDPIFNKVGSVPEPETVATKLPRRPRVVGRTH